MVTFYNNLSPTTKLLVQSFLAILGSVLAGVLTAVYQSYILSQQLNLAILWNVALITFLVLFSKAMHDWIPAHAQQLIQSYEDEKKALQDALQRSQQVTSAVIATRGSQVQSTSPQAQIQQIDVNTLSQQIALNLINMAAKPPAQPQASAPPTPAQDAYEDPLRVSMKLPAYTPPINTLATSATAIQNPQFTVPPRPVTMP